MSQPAIPKQSLLATLPPEWPESLLSHIQQQVRADGRCLVILDDDPTGAQTTSNLPVLAEWSVESLCAELTGDYPAFFILTNTRSMPEAEAIKLNEAIGQNLLQASQKTKRDFSILSRSDSTLRGHFPAECEALAAALAQDLDGWLLLPYFGEGGRLTANDIHFVTEGDDLIPVGQTPFAQDSTFGYRASNLRQWVAEKTNGRILASEVLSISLNDIRRGGPQQVYGQLLQASGGRIIIANILCQRDLEVFTDGLLLAEAAGKRFLYRTAASFVQVRAGLAPSPLLTAAQLGLPATGGGLIVAGSYVPKTTRQIERLLVDTDVYPLEVQVEALLDEVRRAGEIDRVVVLADKTLAAGRDVVIYTSRDLVQGGNGRSHLDIGQQISASLVQIVQSISTRPRYLVAKGGITASDIATEALNVRRTLVAGQILPGVPVWHLGRESRYPGLAYIIFPGNVGEVEALAELVSQLQLG